MHPSLIAQPNHDADIIAALQYAKSNKLAVAIKTGGHQYSGASSTSGENIVIDLKLTFKDMKKDLKVLPQTSGKTWVYASVSWNLGEFNGFLKNNKLFIPHGQCTAVHLGGHAQTGGYGQLGRCFGLLGDHVREIRLIGHDAQIRTIDRSSDSDLFNAILGGSPGNFGIVTHYTLEVYRDADYDYRPVGGLRAWGMKGVWLYSKSNVEALLNKVAEMADNPEFPRNYDLCVSVLSSDFPILHLIPELDGLMKEKHPEMYGLDGNLIWPASVVLYAQWVPLSKEDKYDPKWFDGLADAGSIFHLASPKDRAMSEMTGQWIFRNVREFEHPYVKRTYLTNSTTLGKDGWAKTVAQHIDEVVGFSDTDLYRQCWVSVQIQCFGGNNSMFRRNASNGTSYSWRDSTVCCTLDCFHESSYKETATQWQAENDNMMTGPQSSFSKQDKRVLWGSYGDWDLHKNWQFYYEDEAKYEKLQKVRAAADPDGTFTPNPFAVKRASTY